MFCSDGETHVPKSKKTDVAELLGFTPMTRVTDSFIWSTLVTPMVRAFLGEKRRGKVESQVISHAEPLFPGDEACNLNGHLIVGEGPAGKQIRFPYVAAIYRTVFGSMVIKRDAVKFKACAWFGNIDTGNAELIYQVAMRDRRFDGTLRANDSALMNYCYDDPCNAPLVPPSFSSAEISLYGFLPGTRFALTTGDFELERFIVNPFTFLDKPEQYLELFKRAWKTNRSPGQVSAPIPDVSRLIVPGLEKTAHRCGYDFLEDAASHYHVAMFAMAHGYSLTSLSDRAEFSALHAGIKRLKENGMKLSRAQESWVCAIQSLRPIELIPEGLYLGGPEWRQDNISQRNLWLHKPISKQAIEFARTMSPKPLI